MGYPILFASATILQVQQDQQSWIHQNPRHSDPSGAFPKPTGSQSAFAIPHLQQRLKSRGLHIAIDGNHSQFMAGMANLYGSHCQFMAASVHCQFMANPNMFALHCNPIVLSKPSNNYLFFGGSCLQDKPSGPNTAPS